MEKNLGYNEPISPVPWQFDKSRFHCPNFINCIYCAIHCIHMSKTFCKCGLFIDAFEKRSLAFMHNWPRNSHWQYEAFEYHLLESTLRMLLKKNTR